jgi:hypothetical protein
MAGTVVAMPILTIVCAVYCPYLRVWKVASSYKFLKACFGYLLNLIKKHDFITSLDHNNLCMNAFQLISWQPMEKYGSQLLICVCACVCVFFFFYFFIFFFILMTGLLCRAADKSLAFPVFLLATQPKEFFLDGLKKLEQRGHKCVELRGNT